LLLRSDVEHESHQIDHLLLAGGEKSLTLPAREGALASRPSPGAKVEVTVRQNSGTPSARYGPYTFLGWVAAPASDHDPNRIYFAIGIREDDKRMGDLRVLREMNAPERIVSVEVVRSISLSR
jgi:hypothetical protein